MRHRGSMGGIAIALVAAVLAGGCKGKRKDAGEPWVVLGGPGFAELDRKRQCELVVDQAVQVAVLMLIGLEGELTREGDGKAAVMKCIRDHRDDVGKCLPAGDAAEVTAMRDEMQTLCMTWDDQVFDCIARNDETSDECVQALAVLTGDTPRPKAPPGPAVAWHVDLPSPAEAVVLANDGTVVARVDTGLIAARDGRQVWVAERELQSWMVWCSDGTLCVGDDAGHVVGLDPADGRPRWTATLPDTAADDYDDGPARPVAAALAGDELAVIDSSGRLWALSPAECAKSAQRCLRQTGALAGEDFDSDTRLHVTPAGSRVIVGTSDVWVYSPNATLLMRFRARDLLGDASVLPGASDRIAIVADDQVAVLDVPQCQRDQVIALPARSDTWEECEGCAAPRAGCLRVHRVLADVELVAPAVVDAESVAVNADGDTHLLTAAGDGWTAPVGAVWSIASDGAALYVVVAGEGDDDPFAVRALSIATGDSLWETSLEVGPQEWLYDADDLHVARAGTRLVAGYQRRLAVFELPGS